MHARGNRKHVTEIKNQSNANITDDSGYQAGEMSFRDKFIGTYYLPQHNYAHGSGLDWADVDEEDEDEIDSE